VFSGQDLDFLNQHGSGSSTVSHLGIYFFIWIEYCFSSTLPFFLSTIITKISFTLLT